MRGRRVLGIVPGALVLFSGLVIGHVILTTLPTDAGLEAPYDVTGAVGDPVRLRDAEVTVTDVVTTTSVSAGGRDYPTQGRFVVATYEIRPVEGRTVLLADPRVVDASGRSWPGGTRAAVTCPEVAPGLVLTCTAAVEVPAVTEALTLRIAPGEDERGDAQAVVGLDVPDARDDEPMELPLSRFRVDRADVEDPSGTTP